jgi:predicted HAD superfamily phosphohydrolase YqeG
LKYPADKTVMIGDDYHKDVMFGRINKMKTILVTRYYYEPNEFKDTMNTFYDN